MEAIGFRRRLKEAMISSEIIKIIFQYPASDRAIIKSGIVLAVDEDSFTLDEVKEGECVYSYQFIAEIKNKEDGNEKSKM